ncbi:MULTISPECIES: hypothetical protein [unclassified Bacillus (in: firmicutes)]|uniref:hypothetical protein n=1 Tax=unclassified Bacillus (in: firmicutes) TaxID=185979 RepID=UPI0008F3A9A7|nr:MULTISPECIES: hypothetical protein [unclassified Bacillus (in: firmicutes)]SFA86451.1 hypothetical protein SAMN02799634_102126 [Bacillus sp. UNCCL13]SFQ83704.1 hypothetical protein SAMN04488577_2246 [Bacillus sp. cl95]
MILRKKYILEDELIKEALDYAEISKEFTSNKHDFHAGGLSNKKQKMFEGKLGEKIFKKFLLENNIIFEEDRTSHQEADLFDFIISNKITVDVKTRTKSYHTRTLELVEQFNNKPKDIYVSVRIFDDLKSGHLIGWFAKEDVLRINRIENHGYLDNYTMYDSDLSSMNNLWDLVLKHNKR